MEEDCEGGKERRFGREAKRGGWFGRQREPQDQFQNYTVKLIHRMVTF